MPLAATTYYFASKDELVREALALALAEDVAALHARPLLAPGRELTVAQFAAELAALTSARVRDERATLLVQYELELEAARRPELSGLSRAWCAAYVGAAAPALAALGSRDPERDAWILVTALSGIELELLASGARDAEERLRPTLERLVRALVELDLTGPRAPAEPPPRAPAASAGPPSGRSATGRSQEPPTGARRGRSRGSA